LRRQKKELKEKATADLPCGFPFVCCKNGKCPKLACGSNNGHFLSIFSNTQTAASSAVEDQLQHQHQKQLQKHIYTSAMQINSLTVDLRRFAVDFEFPLVALPIVWDRKWKRRIRCLSRRRVSDSSHFLTRTIGNP
jgi:hypothetical protein